MAKKPETEPEIVDPSHLTDADWTEINKFKTAWNVGGLKALSTAIARLSEADPVRYMNVIAAYFPNEVREAIKDEMAEKGMTEEDLRELIRKLESPAGQQ